MLKNNPFHANEGGLSTRPPFPKSDPRKDGGRHSHPAPKRNGDFFPFSQDGLSLSSKRLGSLKCFKNADFNVDCGTDISVQELIARGAFANVHEGIFQKRKVAIKIQALEETAQCEAALLCELTILKELKHERIVRFLGAGFHKSSIYFVMELCSNGALRECLQSQKLGWNLKTRIGLDVATAVLFLHSKEIMHRDIKTPNVLIDGNWRAKLCDFSFCIDDSCQEKYEFVCGTKEFISPEMNLFDYDPNGQFGLASDMYSFGVVLAEMLTEIQPGNDGPLDLQGTYENDFRADTKQVEIHSLKGAPESLIRLAIECLKWNPEERATSEQAVEWLEDLLQQSVGDTEVEVPAAPASPPRRLSTAEVQEREGEVRHRLRTHSGCKELKGVRSQSVCEEAPKNRLHCSCTFFLSIALSQVLVISSLIVLFSIVFSHFHSD